MFLVESIIVQKKVRSMDIDISANKKRLSLDEIAEYREQLKRAIPYTQEEIVNMPFDECDFDIERMQAFNAQRALKEAGVL